MINRDQYKEAFPLIQGNGSIRFTFRGRERGPFHLFYPLVFLIFLTLKGRLVMCYFSFRKYYEAFVVLKLEVVSEVFSQALE